MRLDVTVEDYFGDKLVAAGTDLLGVMLYGDHGWARANAVRLSMTSKAVYVTRLVEDANAHRFLWPGTQEVAWTVDVFRFAVPLADTTLGFLALPSTTNEGEGHGTR